jgi:hypothetical protein
VTRRVARGGLVAVAGTIGVWALLAPASFAHDLGLASAWVATDGPYNEHLVRDVGGLHLALAVLTAGLGRRADAALDRLLGVAWLVTAVPHLAYHATHLSPFGVLDALVQTLALAGVAALAAVLVLSRDRSGARPDADVPA